MRFCYIQTGNNYAPDKHLIDGLRQNEHTVFEISGQGIGIKKYLQLARTFLKNKTSCEAVIVGYTLPHFVPLIRFLTLKKVIFNAVASQYEANIISRGTHSPWSFAALKWWLIDTLSFHISSHVLLESNAQIEYIHTLFLVPHKKMKRLWIGTDEAIFFRDTSIKKYPEFTVLFRAAFLPESGIDTIIKTAKLLEDKGVNFLIIGRGFLYRTVNSLMEELHPKNLTLIQEILPYDELRGKMLSCHVSLGQVADHQRLARTLPFKLYESLALGLPYLTGRSAGVLELLKDGETCITVDPGNPSKLAGKILFLKNNPEVLTQIGEQGYAFYHTNLASQKVTQELIASISSREN